MVRSQGRGPDIAPHKKGQPYFLPKSSYLSANLYRAWWLSEGSKLHEEQVLAESVSSVKNKVSQKFHIPKAHIGVRLIMRKGAYKSTGLRYIK